MTKLHYYQEEGGDLLAEGLAEEQGRRKKGVGCKKDFPKLRDPVEGEVLKRGVPM